MDKRIAIIGIVVENRESVPKLNELLHEASEAILGRMGIPLPQHQLNVISVAICADERTISTLSGKIGRLSGVSASVTYARKTIQE